MLHFMAIGLLLSCTAAAAGAGCPLPEEAGATGTTPFEFVEHPPGWLAQLPPGADLAAQQALNASAAAAWPGAYTRLQQPTVWRRPVFLCIGDSQTEMGLSNAYKDGRLNGWVGRLAAYYAHRADVLNRGFSGFTTRTMLLALPEVLQDISRERLGLALVMFGINDSWRMHSSAYKANLIAIVQQLLDAGARNVVLVTPAPVNDDAPRRPRWQGKPSGWSCALMQKLAGAVREAAVELPGDRVAVYDLWARFHTQPGWQTQLLNDEGSHFSIAGQDVLFEGLAELLETRLPHLWHRNMPWHHATWSLLPQKDDARVAQLFSEERAAWEAAFPARGGC